MAYKCDERTERQRDKQTGPSVAITVRTNGWLEFAGVENDGPSKNRGWNLQDWKMTDEVAGVEFAGLENDGLENDGLEQEQTQVLHTLKTYNVYDM